MFNDAYDVILLDQARTFMFDVDRFGPDADFYKTYAAVGGDTLSPEEANQYVAIIFQHLLSAYENR